MRNSKSPQEQNAPHSPAKVTKVRDPGKEEKETTAGAIWFNTLLFPHAKYFAFLPILMSMQEK